MHALQLNNAGSHSDAQATLLMLDDDTENQGILGGLLQPHYKVMAAPSGERALQIAASAAKPDLIRPIVLARVRTQLEPKRARDWLTNQNAYLEAEVNRRMQDILLIQDITIKALAEIRDPETGNHIRRTQEYMRILAVRLQSHPKFKNYLTDKVVELLVKSAPLHDIGKVGIPDHILLKPDKLTTDEWDIMKTHSQLGAAAIDRSLGNTDHHIDFLAMTKQIISAHHERGDGGGYPHGLHADAVPIPARLMALADVFDAMIS